MTRSFLSLAAVALLAMPLSAQGTNPGGAYYRLHGGVSVPTGDYADFYELGFRGAGTIGWQLAGIPFGFDLELAYDRLGGDEVGPVDFDDIGLWSGTVNVRYDVETQGSVQPYIVAGGGIYHATYGGTVDLSTDLRLGASTVYDEDSETKGGFNAGVGLLFGRARTRFFVEARYTSIFVDGPNFNIIPVTIGVQWGPPRL
jgi:opacity protein-like surface antigen